MDLCSHTKDRNLLMSMCNKETHRQGTAVSQYPRKFPLGTPQSTRELQDQQVEQHYLGRIACKVEDQCYTQDMELHRADRDNLFLHKIRPCNLEHRFHLQDRSLYQVLNCMSSLRNLIKCLSKLHSYQGKEHR